MTNPADPKVQRRLAAILAADVVGFSSLMSQDEEGTLRRIKALRQEMIEPRVNDHHGRVVKTTGDGFLIEFPSPLEAVRCAVEIQEALAAEAPREPFKPLQLRMGINLGDIIIEPDGDIYGEGVNIAARLEQIAEPEGINVSGKVYEEVRDKLPYAFEDTGEQQVKNIARPVRVFRIPPRSPSAGRSAIARSNPNPSIKPSIAVLPFTNLGEDPEQEYFADGVVEDIITSLSRLKWLFVIARNSTVAYKRRIADVRQVGRELGVRYLLGGTIRRAGNRVRITAQLIESDTGHQCWADRYEGDLADIFDLQDRITESIVAVIEPNIRSAEIRRARGKPTESLDAYDLYLQALYYAQPLTDANMARAEELLRTSLDNDPDYGDALAALAECIMRRVGNGWIDDFHSASSEARDLARRAVAADPANGLTLSTAAWVLTVGGAGNEPAVQLARKALAANPASALVRTHCGWVFVLAGDGEFGIHQFLEAQRLNPLDPLSHVTTLVGISAARFFAGRFEEAAAAANQVLEQVPSHNVARRYLTAALAHLGRLEEARTCMRELLERQPNYTISRNKLISFGQPEMAELLFDGLRSAGAPE